MTMTREEYLEFVLKEHVKILNKDHKNAPTGSTIVFHGFYGRAEYRRAEDGHWERTIK